MVVECKMQQSATSAAVYLESLMKSEIGRGAVDLSDKDVVQAHIDGQMPAMMNEMIDRMSDRLSFIYPLDIIRKSTYYEHILVQLSLS
jgi:hypothetical protein